MQLTFFELATTLKNLGARCLSEKKVNFTPCYQGEVVTLIKHQILVTNLQGNVWQPEGRINNQILGIKGLIRHTVKYGLLS